MSSKKDFIRFVEVGSGIYFVKESTIPWFEKEVHVTADKVVPYLNSNSTNVTIEDRHGSELWTNF